jgi:hypothetical protein
LGLLLDKNLGGEGADCDFGKINEKVNAMMQNCGSDADGGDLLRDIESLNQNFEIFGKRLSNETANLKNARKNLETNRMQVNNCFMTIESEINGIQNYHKEREMESDQTIDKLETESEMIKMEKEFIATQYMKEHKQKEHYIQSLKNEIDVKNSEIQDLLSKNNYLSHESQHMASQLGIFQTHHSGSQNSNSNSNSDPKPTHPPGFMQQFNSKFTKPQKPESSSFHNELLRISQQETPSHSNSHHHHHHPNPNPDPHSYSSQLLSNSQYITTISSSLLQITQQASH